MKTRVFYTLFVLACLGVIAMIHTIDSAKYFKGEQTTTEDYYAEWTPPATRAEFIRRQGKINYDELYRKPE